MSAYLLSGQVSPGRGPNPAGVMLLLVVLAVLSGAGYFVVQTLPAEEQAAQPMAEREVVEPARVVVRDVDDLAIHLGSIEEELLMIAEDARRAQEKVQEAAPGLRRLRLQTQVRRLESSDSYLWNVRRRVEAAIDELRVVSGRFTQEEER